jgi:ATP-binding cassette subfamily B protein
MKPEELTNKPIPFRTPFQYMRFISKPHWVFVLSAFLVVIVASTISQSTNYLFKLIIDAVEGGRTNHALLWGLAFPVVAFAVQCLYRLSGYFTMQWTTRVRRDGFNYLFSHTIKHSHNYFISRFAGSIHSKIRNVVEGFDHLIPDIIWTFTDSVVSITVTFFFILSVDTLSALLFLALIMALLLANKLLAPRKLQLAKANAQSSSALHANMIDILSNVATTRQYVRQGFEIGRVEGLADTHRNANAATWLYTEWMLLVNSAILFIFSSGMFYILVTRWSVGDISTGEFILVASLISHLARTLLFIGRAFNGAARTVGEIREGFEELLIEFDIVDVPDAKSLVVSEGLIEVRDVLFEYDKNRVFDRFNLYIKPGERIGLVGPSGAGKTTFVSLLLRQYDLTDGAILIDGFDIRSVTQESLRAAIAVVPQEPMLFHRTIKENIAYGNPQATDDAIIEAAKRAQAHEFITALPLAYDTMVGERGVKLSGGQKQRVAIARAMLKNAPILVLDEATSALDSESEVEIQKALHVLMAGKTVVAIAHRLSTLREMDRILVLEGGKIVEDGPHEALKDAGGTYARLWNHQAGGFLQE